MLRVVAIDPSGNFEDGKGHTGIAWMHENNWELVFTKSINAKDFKSRFEYWQEIVTTVLNISGSTYLHPDGCHVVIEKYVTRNNGYTTGKMSETSMLIGVLVYECEKRNIPVTFQTPSQAKLRYPDKLLPKMYPTLTQRDTGYYYLGGHRTNDHERDALRHLAYFKNYMEGK